MGRSDSRACRKGEALTNPQYLSEKEAATACGVTSRTFRRWVAADKEIPRERDGKRYRYPISALAEWLAQTGRLEEAGLLQGGRQQAKPAKATRRKKQAKQPVERVEQPGEMDIFAARNLIARMLVGSVEELNECKGRELFAASKTVRETAEALRKLELDCLTVDEKLKNVLPVSFALKLLGRILSNTRTNIMSLRYSMAQDLAAMDSETAIDEYLQARFAGAMRELETSFLSDELRDFEA